MTLAGDLLRAEWAARPRAYVVLAILVAGSTATYFFVLASVQGLEVGLGNELSDTLGSDARLTHGKTGLGEGDILLDSRDKLDGLRALAPAARYAPRLETQAIFLRGADFTTDVGRAEGVDHGAGVLIGIDPASEKRLGGIDAYVHAPGGVDALGGTYTTPTGAPAMGIVVGDPFLQTTNATVWNGTPSWSSVYNVTVGVVDGGQLLRAQAVVIGTYHTGFRMIDRLVVYAARSDVARLMGFAPGDPPANVVLVSLGSSDRDALDHAATTLNLTVLDARAMRESYLGPAYRAVRASAWGIVAILTATTTGWIAHTMTHHIATDKRKLAALRALGIPRRTLERTYTGAGALVGATGGAVGVLVGLSLEATLKAAYRALHVAIPPPSGGVLDAALLLLVATLTAVAAALYAVRGLRRQSIRDALTAID